MNNKYYVTIEVDNSRYIGKVFLVSTNQLVYTSKSYFTQEQAASDARTFVITSAPPTKEPEAPKTLITTTNYTSPGTGPQPRRRCCGR